jgi:hypothetical protein
VAGSVGELLGRCLASHGIRRVWGDPPGEVGCQVVRVADEALAGVLADADGRTWQPRPGACLGAGGLLRLSTRPGGTAHPRKVASAEEVPAAVAEAARAASAALPATACLQLDIDLSAPSPLPDAEAAGAAGDHEAWSPDGSPPDGSTPDARAVLATRIAEAEAPMLFAGPGVVRTPGAAEALRALASRARLGVSNTWGAKGLFEWTSEHHTGTVGLQERDFELGGFAGSDLVVFAGIDPDESPPQRWAIAPALELPLDALRGSFAGIRVRASGPIPRPPLFDLLARVVQPMYASDALPIAPARVIADLASGMLPGDRLSCDPGLAGFWVARAFPTSEMGSVVVPALGAPGFAAAAALAVSLEDRPSAAPIALTVAPPDEATLSILEESERLGHPVVVEAWGEGGSFRSADEHRSLLGRARASGRASLLQVPVDWSFTQDLLEVAGAIVAWGGVDFA